MIQGVSVVHCISLFHIVGLTIQGMSVNCCISITHIEDLIIRRLSVICSNLMLCVCDLQYLIIEY